jgi:hypothetical protein
MSIVLIRSIKGAHRRAREQNTATLNTRATEIGQKTGDIEPLKLLGESSTTCLLERRATPRRRRKPAHMQREAHLQHSFLFRRTRLSDGEQGRLARLAVAIHAASIGMTSPKGAARVSVDAHRTG